MIRTTVVTIEWLLSAYSYFHTFEVLENNILINGWRKIKCISTKMDTIYQFTSLFSSHLWHVYRQSNMFWLFVWFWIRIQSQFCYSFLKLKNNSHLETKIQSWNEKLLGSFSDSSRIEIHTTYIIIFLF